ncbi:MAG TPA: hypothetical protein PLP01_14080, partial [Phycisphaerae bacterium]|nr:hypothetical protein [Phycisphaerae bacterium]
TRALDPLGLKLCVKGNPADIKAYLGHLMKCSKHMTPLSTGADCCECPGGKVVERAAGPVGLDDSFTRTLEAVLADPKNTVCWEVVRSDPRVINDSFAAKKIDLDDVEKFPATAPKETPSERTLCEVFIHSMAEQYHAVSTGDDYGKSHQVGMQAQTDYRKDHGQVGVVTDQSMAQVGPNTFAGTTTYSNGATTTATIVNGNIVRVTAREPSSPKK